MALSDLREPPPGVDAAGAVVAGLDRCFLHGFARLGDEHKAGLDAFARVFSGTPLDAPVEEAVAAVRSGAITEAHLRTLAAARAALDGARHDALLAQAGEALGRRHQAPGVELEDAAEADDDSRTLLASARQWLLEVALSGFKQLEAATVVPVAPNLEQLRRRPRLSRVATLLTGFVDELMEAVPTAAVPEIPLRRWSDLWCRAMLDARRLPPRPAARTVDGTFAVLGADLRHHEHMVSLTVYGVLREEARVMRTTLSAWKVDAVAGHEVWKLFERRGEALLTALSKHRALVLEEATLLQTGDLIWDGRSTVGASVDPLKLAAATLGRDDENAEGDADVVGFPTPAPLDRHPVQIAVPVAWTGVRVTADGGEPAVEVDGARLPLALERISPLAGLDQETLGAAESLVGLLRFDAGRWAVQPLLAGVRTSKRKVEARGPGSGILASRKSKSATALDILQERAGKLLRA